MDRARPSVSRAGFSLLEVLVALSVAGTLLGLAAPAFNDILLNSQRTAVVNSFVHGIYLARVTAATQGRTVSICRSIDGKTCSNSTANWEQGWIVQDANARILVVQPVWRGGTITSNRRSYSYGPYLHAAVNGTLVFCDRRGPSHARAVIINIAGRPRIATRDADNRPLRCPNG